MAYSSQKMAHQVRQQMAAQVRPTLPYSPASALIGEVFGGVGAAPQQMSCYAVGGLPVALAGIQDGDVDQEVSHAGGAAALPEGAGARYVSDAGIRGLAGEAGDGGIVRQDARVQQRASRRGGIGVLPAARRPR